MEKCNLCNSLLRINGTSKKQFDIPDNPTISKVTLYQNQTCMNDKSVDNDFKPCPNYGLQVNVIEHEEIVDRATTDTDLKKFVEKVIVDKYTVQESMQLATRITSKAV